MKFSVLSALPLLAATVGATQEQVPLRPEPPSQNSQDNYPPSSRPKGLSNPYAPLSVSSIPLIGFGTWRLTESGKNTTASVSWAIQTGYRHIDCAAAYGNEKAVGAGIKDGLKKAGIKREEIWVTSKLWNDHHDPDKVEDGLRKTLSDLGLDYLDLYLMHWPVGSPSSSSISPRKQAQRISYVSTWHAMIGLKGTRHIGVANFSPYQLQMLISSTGVWPAVHQMELHPYLQQEWWLEWHRREGIHVTAYSPLGDTNPIYHSDKESRDEEDPPRLLQNEVLKEIGERRNCSTAQVSLAWGLSRGTSVIPKSKHPRWIEENFAAQECPLSFTDVAEIEAIQDKWVRRFNNPSENWGVQLFEGLEDS